MPIDVGKMYANCRFVVEIDSLIVGGFTECSGLKAEIDSEEYIDVTGAKYHFPKRVKWSNVTLKRGFDTDQILYNWAMSFASGMPKRRNVKIALFSETSGSVCWYLADSFPISWSFPDLNATANSFAIETLVLAHNGLTYNGKC